MTTGAEPDDTIAEPRGRLVTIFGGTGAALSGLAEFAVVATGVRDHLDRRAR
ncbi:hypothetical protein [Roseitranquillus sediminis]|uniref:hypothetical protein n=1 Tax=Roseitranquillus sediminis TaxID=2809051 RepID=UPI001D0C5BDE|nr:hypothetical protein [Roseitranquillus sediminis]MBM9593023.1 hypothetical protein [Roseitranquillus sediminis]